MFMIWRVLVLQWSLFPHTALQCTTVENARLLAVSFISSWGKLRRITSAREVSGCVSASWSTLCCSVLHMGLEGKGLVCIKTNDLCSRNRCV